MHRCSICGQYWDDKQAQDNEHTCTRRCGGRLEPVAPLGLADLKDCDLGKLPYPVALTAQRLVSAMQSSSDFLKTLFLLKDCFEASIKYCGAILLADYRDSPACTPEHNQKLLERIVRPALGDWVNSILHPLSQWLVGGDDSPGVRVASLFASPAEKPGANPSESDLMKRCKEFVTYRNDALGHGANRPDPVYEQNLAEWLPLVRQLLDGIALLKSCRLCLLTHTDRYGVWMGPQLSGATEPGCFSARDIGHFVLRGPKPAESLPAPGAGSGKKDILDLFPFLCYVPDSRMENRLHYYDHLYRYKPNRKEATVLEYDNGERHPSPDPVPGLEEIFTRALLEETFNRHRQRMEVIEGQAVNSDELLEAHAGIVGRRFVIDRVRRFLAEHDRGLLVIEAQPGKGKTAVLAHLIEAVFSHSAPQPVYFFYRRTAGITDPTIGVRSLYAALLKAHGITEAEESKRNNSPAEVFTKLTNLLNDLIAPRLLPGRPQLIFIDALDEATGNAFQQIPENLPAGVYIIASTRPVADRTALAPRQHLYWFDLDDPDLREQNYRDGFDYITQELAASALPNETLDEVARLGAGNFLVLKLLCRHLNTALRPDQVGEFLRRLATDAGKDQLGFIYQEFWERLTQRCSSPDVVLLCNVAGVLVTAHGWLTVDMICEMLGLRAGEWDFALRRLAEYLTVVRLDQQGTEETFYRIYHESFADFLRTRVAIDSDHYQRLLANYSLRWAEMPNGYGRDYALAFAPSHLKEAKNWQGLADLAPGEKPSEEPEGLDFLQARAARFGTWEALRGARQIAEGLAPGENKQGEAFLHCAFRYCDLSQEVRGDVEGLARMIQRGEIHQVLNLIEGDPDRFRRGLFLILVAPHMRQHGHDSLASELERTGAAFVAAQLEGDKQTLPGYSAVTVRLAYALHRAVGAPGGLPGSSPAMGDTATSEEAAPANAGVPWIWILLGYLGRATDQFLPLAIALLFSTIAYGVVLSQFAKDSAGPRLVLMLMVAASLLGGWVFPLTFHMFRSLPAVQRRLVGIMRQLRQRAESPDPDNRREALRRAARFAYLWQNILLPESWGNDLARIVARDFPFVADNPNEAASIASAIMLVGERATDALIDQIKQVDSQKREPIRTEIVGCYQVRNTSALEIVRTLAEFPAGSSGWELLRILGETASANSDAGLLLEFLDEYTPEAHELKSAGGDARAVVASALARTSLDYLRRVVLASLERDQTREITSRRSRMNRLLRRGVRRWLSPRNPLRLMGNLFVLLLLAPLVLVLVALPFFILELGFILVIILLAARRHDPYLLSRTSRPDDVDQWRHNLAELLHLTEWPAQPQGESGSERGLLETLGFNRLFAWTLSPLAMRRIRDTLLAQAILRKDGYTLALFGKSAFGRTLRRLIRKRLLNYSDMVLAVMNDRRLLNTAARAAPHETYETREVTGEDDRQQLRRVLPLRPAWLSFVLVAGLSCPATALVLGAVTPFIPPSARAWLVGYGIGEAIAFCLFLAFWQHLPSLLIEFGVISNPVPEPLPPGAVLSWPRRVLLFFRKLLFASRKRWYPMLAGCIALVILVFAHGFLRSGVVDDPVPGADGLLYLFPPFLITNLLVPALIARWRGSALLYPDPSRWQLPIQRWGSCAVFAGCLLLLIGQCWRGTLDSYPRWTKRFILQGHKGATYTVAFSPDGSYLASGGYDNQVKLWDLKTGRELAGWTCGGRISSVAFSPDGKTLAASSMDNTIRFWAVPSGKEIRTVVLSPVEQATELTYSPDGNWLLAAVSSDTLLLGWLARPQGIVPVYPPITVGNIHLYDAATGKKVQVDSLAHSNQINSVAFSPDSRFYASGGGDQLAKIWDRQRNGLVHSLEGHQRSVTEVAFSQDGKRLASASSDRSITIWDAEKGTSIATVKGHEDAVQWVGFHPTRPLLASTSSDKTLRIWDLSTATRILQITATGKLWGGAISPDGRYVAITGEEKTVAVWEMEFADP